MRYARKIPGVLPIWLILGPNQPQSSDSAQSSEPGKFDGFPGKIRGKERVLQRKKERKSTCEHARLVGRLSTALAVAGAAAVGERGGVAGGCDVPAHA